MGGTTFDHYAPGSDVAAAFREAHEQASYEHGHGGYSGTIAEKPGYVVITHTPLLEREAYALASKLIDSDDPRISDKWGDAGAIPVISGTRQVTVKDFSYVHDDDFREYGKIQSALLEAVTPLLKLKRGETVERISVNTYETPNRVGGYGRSYSSKVTRSKCQATVVINKPPTTRKAPVTFEIPGGLSWEQKNKEIQTRVESMKLKAGESIVGWTCTKDTPGRAKVTAVAPKGATETRFVIKGGREHTTWETGFASQAEARAYATDYMSDETKDFREDNGFLEVESVTRRADGQALVRVTREVSKRQVDVEVEVKLASANAATQQNPDGWLFFGWASC